MFIYCLLTERCNLSCNHCIRGPHNKKDIKKDDYFKIIANSKKLFHNVDIVLTGGEPTIHPDFKEILTNTLHEIDGNVIVTSNGTTSFYEQLNDFNHYTNLHIQFSIDGNEKTNDSIRGHGTFKKIMSAMDALLAANMKIWVSTVVTPENIDSINELRDILVDYHVEKWHVNPILPFGNGNNCNPLPCEDWNNLVDHLIKTTPLRLGIKKIFDFHKLQKMQEDEIKLLANNIQKQHLCNCGSGNHKIYVYPDLSVYGCTCLTAFPFGNLEKQPLEEIMISPNALLIKNYKLSPTSPCLKCKYVDICNGGCIGMSFHHFRELGIGDKRCPLFAKN